MLNQNKFIRDTTRGGISILPHPGVYPYELQKPTKMKEFFYSVALYVFYIASALPILYYEVVSLFYPKEMDWFERAYMRVMDILRAKKKLPYEVNQYILRFHLFSVFISCYMLWTIAGLLFSGQRPYFGLLILFSLISFWIDKKWNRPIVWGQIDAILSILIILFIIINRFVLHLDIWQLF